jgi:lipoprotein-anchoring transpeptidase ErfK/SrfK
MSTASCRMDFRVKSCWLAVAMLAATAWPAFGGEREAALRRAAAWQVSLDAAGFSPGLIDGHPGAKTELATREYQKANGLPVTGQLDKATAEALQIDPDGVFVRYTIEPRDMEEIGPCPTSWIAKSKLKYLGHEGLENVIGEKFHCSLGLLATLNPRKQINSLSPGDMVVVPTVLPPAAQPKAARLEVNLAEKTIRVVASSGKVVGLFHCSIAKHKEKLPSRDTQVAIVSVDPTYRFDPDMWPEVKERIPAPIMIPRGPRNPVGRCWIGLGLKGYGMHGTPNPELIGKTGSHGCFRLSNWDAQRLGQWVQEGTPVKFAGRGDVRLASTP